jgi:hypothetical protein
MTIYSFTRVSTIAQAEEGAGRPRQLDQFRGVIGVTATM